MPKELPKDALFLAPPFRAEKRSAQASAHRLRLFVRAQLLEAWLALTSV